MALPDGVMLIRLNAVALKVCSAVLKAVKQSQLVVTQLLQENNASVSDAKLNGLVSEKEVPLSQHYRDAQKFSKCGYALYMHNKSLIEVVGRDLTHQLYSAVQPLAQDVLVNYPMLYVSNNPKSSSDVLVGSEGSWSPLHQDLPLFCTSVVLVLEGYKEFVVVSDDIAPSLRINMTAASWGQPVKHNGRLYPDLKSLVTDTGGAVLPLHAGDLLVIAPRVFHLARNCAHTVSCNFSVCRMGSVPVAVSQTLVRIEESPHDLMHFDSDFTRLLVDCTKAILDQDLSKANSISKSTSCKRLPAVRSILDSSTRLMEWYMTLQCIPKGWVKGFWGEVRTRLLSQLLEALPLHNPLPLHSREGPAGGGGGGRTATATAAVAGKAASNTGTSGADNTRPARSEAATSRPKRNAEAATGKKPLRGAVAAEHQQEPLLVSGVAANAGWGPPARGGPSGLSEVRRKRSKLGAGQL